MTTPRISKGQQFALDYILSCELRRPESVYGKDDMHRYPESSALDRRSLCALERRGLVRRFSSTSERITESRGRGVRNTAQAHEVDVDRWMLTPEGREVANPIQTMLR